MDWRSQTLTYADVGVRRATVGFVRSWRPLALALVLSILYYPVLDGLIRQWYYDGDYSHGFVVPIFSGYLIWRKWPDLTPLRSRPSLFGLFMVLASLAVLGIGEVGAELFLTRISLLGTVVGMFLYFWGWARLRALAFPIGFLLFMVPLPALIHNQIVFPLQLLASRFATFCLEATRIVPVLREGNILILPNCSIEVVGACSGIRSLISQLALGLGYGYLAERSVAVRVLLGLAMVPVAIVSNGVRVMGTAVLTYHWGAKLADGFFHWFSGWVIFLVAIVLMLCLHTALVHLRRFMRTEIKK